MKWRVKTKEEFVTSGQWVTDMNIPRYKGYPAGWNKQGLMNEMIGSKIPEELHENCKNGQSVRIGKYWLDKTHYVSEQSVPLIVHTPDSTLENPKFDYSRLAKQINEHFQVRLNEATEKFDEKSKDFSDKTDKLISDLMGQIGHIYGSIREDLIAEVAKGRETIILPDSQEISIMHLDHPEMANVIKSINLYKKVMLVGPAGTGKTYMVAEIANRLKLPFYKYSCSRDSSVHDLLGYKQPASETYLETVFLQAYENGGVFLVDEYDAMSGDMALFFNGVADGSKFISIPHRDNKPIATRHEDFILVMCGNTWGKGSIEYSGRDFQDLALMDRFRFCRHHIGYNIPLEQNFAGSNYAFCAKLREVLEKSGSYLSTRNIEDISKLFRINVNKDVIVEMVVSDLEPDSQRTVKRSLGVS